MKIEEFIEKRSISGVCTPSDEDVKSIIEYVKRFNSVEIIQFSEEMSHLYHIAKDSLSEEDLGMQMKSLYAIIRMIETMKDSREMLRETFICKEFCPTTPS